MKQKLIETQDATGMKLVVCFLQETHHYEVEVSKNNIVKTETFQALYCPLFGMNVIDQSQALDIANKLAAELDNE